MTVGKMRAAVVMASSLVCMFTLLACPSSWASGCPNEGFRTGASAGLPDCRAYELVTPRDANGRTAMGLSDFKFESSGALFATEPITSSGESLVFMTSNQPLGGIGGLSGTFDVTEAKRAASGWEIVRRLSPGEEKAVFPTPGGISADHLYTFTNVQPVLRPVSGTLSGGTMAAEGDAQYLGNPDGSFELVGIGTVGGNPATERLAQGRYISPGGEHVIFSTGQLESGSAHCFGAALCPVRRLADNAPPEGIGAVYDRSADGPTTVVSLLPGPTDAIPGSDAAYQGVSRDGSTVAFKIGANLYVRVPDAEDGHTLAVAGGDPVYAGLSADGHYLFYVMGGEKGTIHRFDTSNATDVAINPSAEGEVVNVSGDGSHVYYISEEEVGGEGEPGKPNLFAWSGGTSLVATVAPSDLEQTSNEDHEISYYPALTRWTGYAVAPELPGHEELGPGADSSRTTPDGSVLVFESKAQLSGFDNAGHTEIYRWDASNGITCVSCSSLATSASADARLQYLNLNLPPVVLNNVSVDGSRVFFETEEALVPGDTDGINDVYEWHMEAGGPVVDLISSGQSKQYLFGNPSSQLVPRANVIYGITPDGSNVVFLSQDELVPGAGSGGTSQLYDARVGGGFPSAEIPAVCLEEACRGAGPSAPSLAGVPSETTKGSGNVKPRKHKKHRCRGSKYEKHNHCAKPKSKKKGKASSSSAAVAEPLADRVSPSERDSLPAPGATSAPSNVAKSSPTTSAGDGFEEFGIESVSVGESTTAAGMHPDLTVTLRLNHGLAGGVPYSSARTEDISVKLPPGLLGNPRAVPRCSTGEFMSYTVPGCPPDSQVGIAKLLLFGLKRTEPIYNLEPPHPDEELARFGFFPNVPVFIEIKVRTSSDYGVTAVVHQGPGQTSLIAAETTLWGNPADSSHDENRLTKREAQECDAASEAGIACKQPGHKRASTILPADRKSFLSNPSACQEGQVGFSATSYQLPGQVFEASTPFPTITECQGLPFNPSFSAQPTSRLAGGPTGLNTKLTFPQHLGEQEKATATMREARVTLPAGMQVNAAAANWIGTCSDAQVGFHEEVDTQCPGNSKLGTATISSPALSMPIEGSLYQRTPSPGHQFGLWLVADAVGLHIKIPGELKPDPSTGRLTAVFSDLPQVPVEEIDLNVWGGARAPLQNPDHCGTYATDFSFAPHSQDPLAVGKSQMTIDEGCNQGFNPTLSAGATDPVAAKYSPLIVDLARPDGDQALRGFELELPDGQLAKLKGVPLCPDGPAQSGSCPADSAIGHVVAASGAGPEPLWVPQPGKAEPKVFLAGPHDGSPFSVVTEVPAQAGPFDLGTVVVRSGLGLNPDTNRAVVKADPLPQFFEGVGLSYRRLHVVVDRPNFALNGTDCREQKVGSSVTSTLGAVAHPSSRFQLEGCKRLKFKPKLSIKLRGGTKRAAYPALTAVLKARKGDANIAQTSVALPHSEFLAQEHIGTICTRKQFAADKCPKGSIYGKAKAWTPLLAKPLSGPVYLRSSNHLLPDLVAALGGELDVNLVGRIDSDKAGGIRSTFEAVPDAPVTKFVLKMNGGKKSLLTNSTDICLKKHRATVKMAAQNGRILNFRPVLGVRCAK